VLILSNSANDKYFVQQREEIERNLAGLMILKTQRKKPFCFEEAKAHFSPPHSSVQNHNMAFVGDRLLTDVLLANANGAISVYVQPLSPESEGPAIRACRTFESVAFRTFTKRRNHDYYPEGSL